MLIFPSEIQSESSGFASCTEAGYGIETFLIRATIIVDECLPKMEAVSEWSACDAAETGIGTFKAVSWISKIGEGMGAGIEFLPDREINLIGFGVAGSEILEIRRLIQYVCNAQSCPGSKSEIGVVDITKRLQAVERRIYPAVNGDIG